MCYYGVMDPKTNPIELVLLAKLHGLLPAVVPLVEVG